MCDLSAKFTTVAGPRHRVEWFVRSWSRLTLPTGASLQEVGVHRVIYPDLALLNGSRVDEEESGYRDPYCGALAVVSHDSGRGSQVAGAINTALMTSDEACQTVGLLVEPGHTFSARSGESDHDASQESRRPGPHLDGLEQARARMADSPPVDGKGRRVAVLDSGDKDHEGTMLDFTSNALSGPPWFARPAHDDSGHGTAVAAVIRAMAPQAEVTPFRVLGGKNKAGSSASVYLGLIAALWDERQFDVVNASFGVSAGTDCGTMLGRTFSYLMAGRWKQRGRPLTPVLVVAAPTDIDQHLTSPSDIPGARVVAAWGAKNTPADYCSRLKGKPDLDWAPGGTREEPLGRYYSAAAKSWPIYGTSFAAALVSGHLVAGADDAQTDADEQSTSSRPV